MLGRRVSARRSMNDQRADTSIRPQRAGFTLIEFQKELPDVTFDTARKLSNGILEVRGKNKAGKVREVEFDRAGKIVEIE
jgi:hypothetical protein